MQDLAHFFKQSHYHMADITRKAPRFRRAIAMGRILVGETGWTHIKDQTLPKGDVLKLAEIAGVQGAKMAWQQIPMCHPLLLEHVAVYPHLEDDTHSVAVYASVSTTSKTGVEMEALAAVNAALLTLYDLTKPVEVALTITDIRLLMKEGGKKGLWLHPAGAPEALQTLLPSISARPLAQKTAAIITLSDRAARGIYEDKSGAALKQALDALGCHIAETAILPDEPAQLEAKIAALTGHVDLILTTGGTGPAPRDITPDVLSKMADTEIPGIGELLRSSAAAHVPTTWLSRSLGVIIKNTLVIALPGSTGGVKDGMAALTPLLAHTLALVQTKKHPHGTAS